MSRRGHMSHKVPNVKLRPAPAPTGSKARIPSPEIWKEAYGYGLDDDEMIGMDVAETSKPFKDVVITITGAEDKAYLTGLVRELGGRVESALTIHVTHVIASSYGSPKYAYAVEHRIPVVRSEWIVDSHRRYIHAEEVNWQEDMERFRLLPFSGLTIAMSGIEPLERRRELVRYITEFGGTYNKDLGRTCTHLIAAKPTTEANQSEKVKWAMKENVERERKRRKWKKDEQDMAIVYEEWIWDCVAYRGRFAEQGYDASKPRPRGKVRAEDVLRGCVQEEEKPQIPAKVEKKEDDEPALVRKRKGQAMDLVGDIISISTGKKSKAEPTEPAEEAMQVDTAAVTTTDEPRVAEDVPIPAESKIDQSVDERMPDEIRDNNRWNDRPARPDLREQERPSILHIPRADSFTIPGDPKAGPSRLPSRSSESAPISKPEEVAMEVDAAPNPAPAPAPTPSFFDGLRFSHVIKENVQGLEKALQKHGGILVPDADRLAGAQVDYVIMRLNSTNRPDLGDGEKQPTLVTECWIEACCFERRILSPDDHLVFRPLPGDMPIPGADELNIHLSGYGTGDTVYLKRLIRVIGAKQSPNLSKGVTYLITPTNRTRKVEIAFEWSIPVVKDSWLLEMGRSGAIEPLEDHALPRPTSPVTRPSNRTGTTSSFHPDISFDQDRIHTSTPKHLATDYLANPHRPTSSPVSAVSQARSLKPAATHVDQPLLSGEGPSLGSVSGSQPLSAPGPERERALNKASSEQELGNESIDSKISRTTSAPLNGSSKEDSGQKRSASAGGVGMTEALKQLAAKGELTPKDRSKSSRRPRTASRLKTSVTAHHSITHSISPSSHASAEDSRLDERPDIPEESARVKYVDPTGERETRKLLALISKGDLATRSAS